MAKRQDNRQARESLERVLALLTLVSEYIQHRSALNSALKAGAATEEMVRRAADSDSDLQDELTAMLAHYNFVVTVYARDTWPFRGRFDADAFACLTTDMYPGGFQKADAVLLVFQLAQQKLVSNVRACSRCLRFFYSSKRNRKFCSTSCRSHYWNATDEAKKARREAAKKRRAEERDEDRNYRAKMQSEGRL